MIKKIKIVKKIAKNVRVDLWTTSKVALNNKKIEIFIMSNNEFVIKTMEKNREYLSPNLFFSIMPLNIVPAFAGKRLLK